MAKKVKPDCKIKTQCCKTCPFTEGGWEIHLEKMAHIYGYLMDGYNHLCHSDRTNRTICRGGRNWQLEVWARSGKIKEPTDQALAEAMIESGMQPGQHITPA